MIISVSANQPGFKAITLARGLNLIVTARTLDSTNKDSRNGSGKSLLIEIIDFCLGADFRKDSALANDHLKQWAFTTRLKVAGQIIDVTRSTAESKVLVCTPISAAKSKTSKSRDQVEGTLSLEEWRQFLARSFFNIEKPELGPSYRSLMNFVIRKGLDAYTNPFHSFKESNELTKQVTNAFFLGLPWEYAKEWEQLESEKKALDALRSAASVNTVKRFVGHRGELEAEIRETERSVASFSAQLAEFKVHTEYEQIEHRANDLTLFIHQQNNTNVSKRQLIKHYQKAIHEEADAAKLDSVEIYERAKIEVPDMVKARLADLREFHSQLIKNRKAYLENEIARLIAEVTSASTEIEQLSEERSRLLGILQTHGALAEYTKLNEELTNKSGNLNELRHRLANLVHFEEGLSDLKIKKETLHKKVMQDLSERETIKNQVMDIFDEYSKFLYEAPGHLIINAKARGMGYDYKVDIKRSGSEGIDKMKIFCYDLMKARIWAAKGSGCGFLIHDSTLFEGVDERQKALALQLAARESEKYGFQYITFFNTDNLPRESELGSLETAGYIRLTLNDKEDGCLLGFRY